MTDHGEIAPGLSRQRLDAEITRVVHIDYLLYLPRDYRAKSRRRWPTVLFLHGAGERGEDLSLVQRTGLPQRLADGEDLPMVVIAPQCPQDDHWWPDPLMALLEMVAARVRIDPGRIYLTGLSMGGYGTWDLAIRHPERFAAIAPICGGGGIGVHQVHKLKNTPTWVFHGEKDTVVPPSESQVMVDALQACGGDVRLTIYPEAEHDSWTRTYANPELYEWFLSHELRG